MKILITAAIILSGILNEGLSQGFLRRSGKSIINDNGPVLLRGLNLGNWLVKEGYLMGVDRDGYKSPTQFKAAIKDLVITDANVDAFYIEWLNNYVQMADLDSIAGHGFNCVRLPFHYDQFYDDATSTFKTDFFPYIDNCLSWCAANQLYLILDMHCAPGGQNNAYHGDGAYLGSGTHAAALWTNYAVNKAKTANIWRYVADRYKNEVWIGGYDLVNEPLIDINSEKWKLRDLYVAVTTAIREVDNNHMIFAEGNYFAWDLWDIRPRWDENMAFSIHNYWSPIPNPSIGDQVFCANDAGVPLYLGEAGENSNTWYNAQVRDAESRNIGWTWWLHKKLETVTSPWTPMYTDNYKTIRNYWLSGGAKPSAANAFNWLIEMAQRTAIQNCLVRKDVVDALIRADFHTQHIPYASNGVPGIVFGVHYDMGMNTIATTDNIFQTTAAGGSFTPWNNGWSLRNDGVDIQWCNDTYAGNNFEVYHMETNEVLKFTINVASHALYTIQYRCHTSNKNGRRLRLNIDGTNLSDVNLPQNNNYVTTTAATDVALTPGSHVLTITVLNGASDFRLHYLNFILTGMLPVTFLDHYAIEENNKVNIHWHTAYENGNKGFVVERSLNGIDFDSLGFVKGENTFSGINKYSFTDTDHVTGSKTYYRIMQIDLDNSVFYSPVFVCYRKSQNGEIIFYPNPADDFVDIFFYSLNSSDDVHFSLIDISGRKLMDKIFSSDEIANPYRLYLRDLAPGLYHVSVISKGTSRIFKLTVN